MNATVGANVMVLVPSLSHVEKPSLAGVCRRISEISTLPHVALLVLEVANRPNAGAGDLKDVMEVDAALTTRVMRCVNSSAHGLRQRITNLQHAIAYLGINTIRNLALTASVSQLFRKEEQHGRYTRKGLWRHLVAVGICARLIAMRTRYAHFEDVYLAGLLHDIGIILEDQYVHKPFTRLVANLQPGKTLPELEREQLGFDHTSLGDEIARAWKMPNGIADAILYHHGSLSYTGGYPESVRCVEVANFLCSLKQLTSVGVQLVAFPREAIRGLDLGKMDLVVIAEDLDREMNNKRDLFQI
jgi:putative nucleotidyltransferase with HDIG domain